MASWLGIVLRQLILYSLPVLVSLSVIGMAERLVLAQKRRTHAFYAIAWHGAWLPLVAAIAMGRGVIIALPRPLAAGTQAAAIRLGGHALLCLFGFLLYSLSLGHPPAAGPPPLYHWWAKVLMFFNLCLVCLHLLPLPGQWLGELLLATPYGQILRGGLTEGRVAVGYALIAASPLLDFLLGQPLIYPIYAFLTTAAQRAGSLL